METLIDEKGWVRQDITVMSSPLSVRTPDGWLQPQPVFNTNPEFAERFSHHSRQVQSCSTVTGQAIQEQERESSTVFTG